MNEDKQLIDSNVLVYAYDSSSGKHANAVRILEDRLLNGTGVVSIQNLVEFCRIVTEKLPRKLTFEQARSIILDLSESLDVVYYDNHAVANALSLCQIYGTHFFDALLIATLEKENITTIITENEKDFKKVSWLNVIKF